VGGLGSGSWDLTASFDLNAALVSAKIAGRVTGVNEILDNQLATTSETNSSSFIDKKFFDIGVTGGPPVPEPAPTTLALAIASCGLLGRRHRARTSVV
jgi:hypothetical protein